MWHVFAVALVGVWLMAAPDVLGLARPAATSAWITGPNIATFATVALWGATRAMRWANLPAGAWLVVAPLVLDHSTVAAVNSVACGCAVAVLSAFRGVIKHRFGEGWLSVVRLRRGSDTRGHRHA